jgi:hypothetical protein
VARHKYTDEDRARVLVLREKGKNFKEISQITNINYNLVREWAITGGGLKRRGGLWTEEEVRILLENYPKASQKDILSLLPNRGWKSLTAKAVSLGIKRDSYIRSLLDFSVVDTEEKSYILGFLGADGFIQTPRKQMYVGLMLADEDIDHLAKIRDLFNPDISLYPTKSTRSSQQDCHRFMFYDRQLCEQLISLGITPQKTKTYKAPSGLSVEMIPHFVRGYFDGDGDMTVSENGRRLKVRFSGTEEVLMFIDNEFRKTVDSSPRKISRERGCYRMSYSGNLGIRFSSFMYKHASLFLYRKRLVAEPFLNEYETPSLFKTKTVAQVTGYKQQTIQHWIRTGKIGVVRPWGPTTNYYIPLSEVNRIIQQKGVKQCTG